jgi:predicted transcriptional regulator
LAKSRGSWLGLTWLMPGLVLVAWAVRLYEPKGCGVILKAKRPLISPAPQKSLRLTILNHLSQQQNQPPSSSEIAAALGEDLEQVREDLTELSRQGRVEFNQFLGAWQLRTCPPVQQEIEKPMVNLSPSSQLGTPSSFHRHTSGQASVKSKRLSGWQNCTSVRRPGDSAYISKPIQSSRPPAPHYRQELQVWGELFSLIRGGRGLTTQIIAESLEKEEQSVANTLRSMEAAGWIILQNGLWISHCPPRGWDAALTRNGRVNP